MIELTVLDPRDQEQVERAARHEAAHAVVARVLGFTVTRVYLYVDGQRGGGNCEHEGGGFGDDYRARAATIAAAGGASDRAQGYDRDGSEGDLAEIRHLLNGMREPFDPYEKADELVAEHERAIDFVAAALYNTGELNGETVDQIMATAREQS